MMLRGTALVTALVGAALCTAGCTTASPPTQSPAAATATTAAVAAAVTSAAATTPVLATPVAPAVDPVAFFRSQQAACAAHAASTGNPVVESDRFSGATQVRDLGDGSYLVRDGLGTELVVQPAKGVVLPPSGRTGDVMPVPYGFGCSEKVFLGASDD